MQVGVVHAAAVLAFAAGIAVTGKYSSVPISMLGELGVPVPLWEMPSAHRLPASGLLAVHGATCIWAFLLSLVSIAVVGFVVLRLRRAVQHRSVRERYGLSACGFVSPAQPSPLPAKFAGWESIAARLPELNQAGQLHAEVEAMPLVGVEPGELDQPALRRARVILTYVVHSYIFGHLIPWQHLKPLRAASEPRAPRWVYSPAASDEVDGGGGSSSTNLSEVSEGLPQLPPQLATPWRQVTSS